MKLLIFLMVLGWSMPVLAQYQTNPTERFPISTNLPAPKKAPQNRVYSIHDRGKGIPLHQPARFYPINQGKSFPITMRNRMSKPVTVWKNFKKPAYSSLYQDRSN